MIKYDLINEHIYLLKHVLHSLYKLELEMDKEAEIVKVKQAIDSVNQSIGRLVALREEME